MIISLDAEKGFQKAQHPFMIKVLERTGKKRHLYIKAIIQQANNQHQSKWRETHNGSTEIMNKTRLSTVSIPIQYSSGGLSQSNKTIKVDQIIQIRKEEIKLQLFADITVYKCNLKNSRKELLQHLSTFSNVPGCKINSKESVAFLYSDDKKTEKEIRVTSLFTIATNSHKYLGVTK